MPLAEPPAIEIEYIGGPTTVLSVAGIGFLTDPTFDAGGRDFPSGSVTLKKLTGPSKSAAELGDIDVALVSHDQHADNLDTAGRAFLSQVPLVLTTHDAAKRLSGGAIGLAPWQTHTISTADGTRVRVTATPARHGPAGIEKLTGEVIGFMITIEDVGDAVYVTGDTVWYEGTAEVARRYDPEVVLLFAGAVVTRGPFYLTMDTNDAVEAAVAFSNATIVPIHHEGWAHFTQSQEDIRITYSVVGLTDRLRLVDAAETIRHTMRGAGNVRSGQPLIEREREHASKK